MSLTFSMGLQIFHLIFDWSPETTPEKSAQFCFLHFFGVMKFPALYTFVLLLSAIEGSDFLSGPQDLLEIAHKGKPSWNSDKFSTKHGM